MQIRSSLRKCLQAVGIIGLLSPSLSGAVDTPQVGNPAPGFSLQDQKGTVHQLSQYAGRWVVLYFYPKDDTPGCTQEACAFRDDQHRFALLGAQVIGVSLDDTASHQQFAEKYKLPFPLLADKEGKVAEQYGALLAMGPVKFAKRYTYLIDPKGIIRKIYQDVDTRMHAAEIIENIKSMTAP